MKPAKMRLRAAALARRGRATAQRCVARRGPDACGELDVAGDGDAATGPLELGTTGEVVIAVEPDPKSPRCGDPAR